MPDLTRERAHGGPVAGIDEAGRGPWAGPVIAAAVILNADRLPGGLLAAIDDSKRVAAAKRADIATALWTAVPTGGARIGVGGASARQIDRDNVLAATLTAMARALAALGAPPALALVDGNRAPDLPCAVRTVIKGDSLSLSIAAASIIAKVTRDRIMTRLAIRYPAFAWERNAGYGTPAHKAALARHGPTPHHRFSFAPVARCLDSIPKLSA
ncbi:MAG: ribonuclease HII [Alphaproteobacteria bacterium]